MQEFKFFDRDLSWLSFNERVLMEAESADVPLFERIRFLSIYSSNLDEFYRVRMPVLQRGAQIGSDALYSDATGVIDSQQNRFGRTLRYSILPELAQRGILFHYQSTIPVEILPFVTKYFFTRVAGFLHPKRLIEGREFFAENNRLYLAAIVHDGLEEQIHFINIPGNHLGRFAQTSHDGLTHLVFLDDILRQNVGLLFQNATAVETFAVKVTRDAELTVSEDEEDIVARYEAGLKTRDLGPATRFLYEPGLPLRHLQQIVQILKLDGAALVEGGRYHNLRDLAELPINQPQWTYPDWSPGTFLPGFEAVETLYAAILRNDLLVHTPYQSYDTVLRFFNEAAIDPNVVQIHTTLYRVAQNSRIAHALINAARNGKQVTVLVEVKARFDEENNIGWARRMKAAGVHILYSVDSLKIHAKLALVKRKNHDRPYLGLFATGNLNETTARFYTDHILLTARQPLLRETEMLFDFLKKSKQPEPSDGLEFRQLLVAQFNLLPRFLQLIDREIANAALGLPARIIIKLNNLQEETLIRKLYEASNAGVEINLIVRGICRLVPERQGQSENIIVKRIVDRYLEHGRIFVFHNNGENQTFMGSADWMDRNIYERIEVCVPIIDPGLKSQLLSLLSLQWEDTVSAVRLGPALENITSLGEGTRSQEAIYQLLCEGSAAPISIAPAPAE